MRKITLIFMCAVIILSTNIFAASLNWSQIPAGTKWVAHIDTEAFSSSKLWDLASRDLTEKQWQKINAFKNLFGVDPTKDIYNVTLFGYDAGEKNATLLVNGNFDKEKLLSLLSLNKEYSESQYKDKTLYHWLDKNDDKQKVGMFGSDNLIVISQNQESVEKMADVLSNDADSLASRENSSLSNISDAPQDAILIIAANELSRLNENNREKAILSNSEMVAAVLGENNGNMYLDVNLTATSPENAVQIEQILNGIKSFIKLKHFEKTEIVSLLNSVSLERRESQLFLNLEYPSNKIYEILKSSDKLNNSLPLEK